ncbi:MAG: type II toxin-antitoxin system HipA family toxin [Myxococcales bacterium]|nr:type II toxin-antitoxin system HipA family toxin [Myxococcales bacterium]
MKGPVAIRLWGSLIGAVAWSRDGETAVFEYDDAFQRSGIEVAPLTMPLRSGSFQFPALPRETFKGLPGLLADALPDRFGNAVINAWLARQQRAPASFDALERLCYVGSRGMGALTFEPDSGPVVGGSVPIDIGQLRSLAAQVLSQRAEFRTSLAPSDPTDGMRDILRVGTSAGGARAKALIAWNPTTNEVMSGQLDAAPGFGHWLLKFDGVAGNADHELADPQGFGAIECAYHHMALAAGVTMTACRLLHEGSFRHFMTRRFDRTDDGQRLHMQSLCALAHLDFNAPRAHSYEAALLVARRLQLTVAEREQLFRRMVFNLVARNQDDHVKNMSFLMDKRGRWSLAPAYDVMWAHNPAGAWTARHQMTVNSKSDHFSLADLEAVAAGASLRRGLAAVVLEEVVEAVSQWRDFAAAQDVEDGWIDTIAASHRLTWPTC